MTGKIGKAQARFSEQAIDDEIVVMSLANGDFFSMTGTACDIWQAIDGTRDREGIVAELAERYNADPGEIRPDVDEFLEQLRDAGFLAE